MADDVAARINRLQPLDVRDQVLEAMRRLGGEAERWEIIRESLKVGGWSSEELAVRSHIRGAARTYHLPTLADYVITTLENRGEVERVRRGRYRLQESAALRGQAEARARFGVPYRSPPQRGAERRPVELQIDLADLDRRTNAHTALQEALVAELVNRGLGCRSPAGAEPQYDLAFDHQSRVWVVELKTLGEAHHAQQFRLGLGQLLEYRHRMSELLDEEVGAALLMESLADERWAAIADSAGVSLLDGRALTSSVDEMLSR
jgi:hypothetical protein